MHIYIYIWIKYAARNLRCMGYTLKTKSHKGQESRTRSQGPGAIDQEPRTKSQAYTMHGAKQNDFAQQAFAMHKHLCNLFPVTASGTKVKALCLTGSADLRARDAIIWHSCQMHVRELAQTETAIHIYKGNQKRKRGSRELWHLFVLLLFAFPSVERIRTLETILRFWVYSPR